ncbi:MAG: sugar phosphate isomerase/epimerase [Tissierellia bacterium]|nr:sugar phosphate isomerase/epimerase [Tissierellia bacterium]
MKIGLCSVTFRKKTVDEIIEIAVKNHLNFIEWGADIHLKPGDFKMCDHIKNLCKQFGISYSYGSYFKYKDEDDFDLILKTAQRLETRDIRIWAMRKSSKDITISEYTNFINISKTIAKKANKLNMNIHFENHRKTLTDTTESAIKLLEDINEPNVYMYWQPQADMTIDERIEALEKLRKYISNVHVFNWDDDFKRYPLKEAKNEWKEYIEHLGKNRAYLLEFVKDDKVEQFQKDLNILKQLMRGN